MIYLVIFISKLLENTFATLKVILVANNKKTIGAILTFIISIIWVLSVSFVVVDFDDYLKIFSFALGSAVGSYFGNTIEEKLALGCIIISFNVDESIYKSLKNALKKYNKTIIKLGKIYRFELNINRKEQKKVIKILKKKDKNIKVSIIKVFNC